MALYGRLDNKNLGLKGTLWRKSTAIPGNFTPGVRLACNRLLPVTIEVGVPMCGGEPAQVTPQKISANSTQLFCILREDSSPNMSPTKLLD